VFLHRFEILDRSWSRLAENRWHGLFSSGAVRRENMGREENDDNHPETSHGTARHISMKAYFRICASLRLEKHAANE
jgi:hypothetical protein